MEQKKMETCDNILEKVRKFADVMYAWMKDSGLLEDGYQLRMEVGDVGGISWRARSMAEMRKPTTSSDWYETRFRQFDLTEEMNGRTGWVILADPRSDRELTGVNEHGGQKHDTQ